jgi:Uma2 family endonuclease
MREIQQEIKPLIAGDHLTWEEFEARWDAMPEVKRAELIGGVVYIMSPMTVPHGEKSVDVSTWLRLYAVETPGCHSPGPATWRMLGDAPQPDACLRIIEECGGKSHLEGKYVAGAPELVAEVCYSSTDYDLHQKMELYHRAGVDEYVAVLLGEQEIRWRCWGENGYVVVPVPADGIMRSRVFPGLWLNVPAMLQGDMARVLQTLRKGLKSAEHAAFVHSLARRRAEKKN